jgi:phosphopantetheinyl transferase
MEYNTMIKLLSPEKRLKIENMKDREHAKIRLLSDILVRRELSILSMLNV